MKKGFFVVIGIIAIIILGGMSLNGSYNTLDTAKNEVQEKWNQLDAEMKSRQEVIPELVEVIKSYASQETGVYNDVLEAGTKLTAAGSIAEKINADKNLSSALGRLLPVVESYSRMKDDPNFIAARNALDETEARLAAARQGYNEKVQSYNNEIKEFPANILAGMFNFQPYAYYQADEKTN